MNTTTRIALGTLAIVLLSLVVVPYLVDWNRYKPELEAWLAEKTGHQVHVAGDLEVRLLPQPRLSMADVTVVEGAQSQAPKLLELGALDLKAAIWPLLTGRIVVNSLFLDRPVLYLKRRADGRLNLGDARGGTARRVIRAGFALAPQDIAINQIEIRKGTLHYRDERLDWSETVTGIDATGQAVAEPDSYRGRASFNWAGRRLVLAAEVGPQTQNAVRSLNGALEEAEIGLKATLTGRLTQVAAAWQIGGALAVRTEAQNGLRGDTVGGNTVESHTAPPFAFDGAVSAGPREAAVKDGVLRWGDFSAQGTLVAQYADQPRFSVKAAGSLFNLDTVRPDWAALSQHAYWPFGVVGLAATTPAAKPTRSARGLADIWQGDLDLKLDALVFAQGRIEAPALKAEYAQGALNISDLTGLLPGDTEAHLNGTLARDGHFGGKVALAGERARELFTWAGVPVTGIAEGRLTRVAYVGGLEWGGGRIKFVDMQAGLDGAQVKGTVGLARAPDGGSLIDADLFFSRLNFDPYRPLFGPEAQPLRTLAGLLDTAKGTVKLAAESLTVEGYDGQGLVADLGLDAGNGVAIKSLKFDDLCGAQLSLEGNVRALSAASSLSLGGNAVGPDLRPLLSRLGLATADGLAPLGPASLDLKAEMTDGTGTLSADGYLSTGKLTAMLSLDKAEAPLLGRLGTGSAETTLTLEAPDVTVLGRLLGFDPPLAPKPADLAPLKAEMERLVAERVPKRQALPLGQAMLKERRAPARYTLTILAGLGSGEAAFSLLRQGEGDNATVDALFDASAADSSTLFAALGVPEQTRAALPGALSLSLRASGPAKSVTLKPLSAAIGTMRIEGEGTLDLSGPRPFLAAALRGTVLDLDALRAVWPRGLHREDVPSPWSERPLDLSAFGRFNGRVGVEADGISIAHLPFTYPKFQLSLQDGTLNLTDLRATLFGGPMTANLALRGGTVLPGFAASVKFIQLDGGDLVKRLWGQDGVQGSFGGGLSVTAQGASTAALATSARGTFSLKSPAGTIRGIDPQNADAVTAFTNFALESDIEDGVAQVRDGRMATADGAVTMTGSARLAPFTLDFAVTQSQKERRVLFQGPLDAPLRAVQ